MKYRNIGMRRLIAVLMGIFFPRIGSRAALIGFLCGTATVFYMNFCTQANFLLFGFVSMLVSVLVALLLSLFIPQDKEQPGLTWKTLGSPLPSPQVGTLSSTCVSTPKGDE